MRGDHDAFAALAAGSVDALHALARLIVRDADRAEDVTQEALVKAWRELPRLRDPDRFDAWLRRLLVNACYDEARRSVRRGGGCGGPPLAAGGGGAGGAAAGRRRRRSRTATESTAASVGSRSSSAPSSSCTTTSDSPTSRSPRRSACRSE